MTDVLIKNWCIPECCMDCDPDFAYAIKCKAYNENNDFTRQRAENCPLVEIKHSQDGDTISRADAIEAVKDTMKRLVDDEPKGGSDTFAEYCGKLAKLTSINVEILKALSALPSAEAEPTVIRSRTLLPTKDFKEWAKRVRETNPNAVVIPCDAEVASAEAVQRWTPCSERLPSEDGDAYIVTDYCPLINRRRTRIAYCYANKDGFWSDTPKGYEVLAWMPLPKPYREDGEA